MKDAAVITIPSHPKYLGVVRSVTAKMGELFALRPDEIEDVKRAVDEACSNVIKYACEGRPGQTIVITYRFVPEGFEVIIEDTGIKAQPETIQGRSLDDVRPGGLGVHLINKAFDIVSFDESMTAGNRLRLVRFRRKEEDRQ